jgi:hypothetical protein
MAKVKKIAVIGECMIELRPDITDAGYSRSAIDAQIGYDGDTLNVATYLARQVPNHEFNHPEQALKIFAIEPARPG